MSLIACVVVGPSATAAAQDATVVQRLRQFAQVPQSEARSIIQRVSAVLSANVRRGGDDWDPLRTTVGRAVLTGPDAGPGRTPQERHDRVQRVLSVLSRGLDERLLPVLFPNQPNAAALCANEFQLTMSACDALIAAGTRQNAELPYAAPDDGGELTRALTQAGASAGAASEAVNALRGMMLSVPSSLTNDATGRKLLFLLEECPGGLSGRESQLRAWHLGPTEGLARCIVEALARTESSPMAAVRAVGMLLRLSPPAATALVHWIAPGAVPLAPAGGPQSAGPAGQGGQVGPGPAGANGNRPPMPPQNPDEVLQRAREAFAARRFAQAAADYETVTRLDPSRGAAFAGLGNARLQLGDARAAVVALEAAVPLARGSAPLFVSLGRAYQQLGDLQRANAAYRQALSIDGRSQDAQAGLASLGGGPNATQRPGGPQGPGPQGPGPQGPGGAPSNPPGGGASPGGPPQVTAEVWRRRGQDALRANQFPAAVQAFQSAIAMDANSAEAFAGIGAAKLAMRDGRGAADAFQNAVRLAPTSAPYYAELGRALAMVNDRSAALAALQQALALDPQNQTAQQGIAALTPPASPQGGSPAAGGQAPLPEMPSRDAIMLVLRPVRTAIAACVPDRAGVVTVDLTALGSTGEVSEATVSGELHGTPEGDCIEQAVKAATFPRFRRERLRVSYPFQL